MLYWTSQTKYKFSDCSSHKFWLNIKAGVKNLRQQLNTVSKISICYHLLCISRPKSYSHSNSSRNCKVSCKWKTFNSRSENFQKEQHGKRSIYYWALSKWQASHYTSISRVILLVKHTPNISLTEDHVCFTLCYRWMHLHNFITNQVC